MVRYLTGHALWSYDHEILARQLSPDLLRHITGVLPYHCHAGQISLTRAGLQIVGDENLLIRLRDFEQLYLGFDEIYTRTMTKNFGLLWQPLRISFTDILGQKSIYLVIDYQLFSTKNRVWFDMLQMCLPKYS